MKHQRRFTNRIIGTTNRWRLLVLLVAGFGFVASLWVGVALGGGKYKAPPLAYVTERDANSVSVIDTETKKVIATIEDVGPPVEGCDPATENCVSGPGGMIITPNGKRGYVANTAVFESGFVVTLANTVSVIDTGRRSRYHRGKQWIRPPRVIRTVEVGYGPLGVAVTPDGKYVYVTNFGNGSPLSPEVGDPGNTVSVIRTRNNKVVDTIEVGPIIQVGDLKLGPLPAGIAITPNGKLAFVANRGNNTVSVIKIKHRRRGKLINEVVATIPVGEKPANVVITPDGKRAYVTNFNTPPPLLPEIPVYSVSVIDTKSYEVLDTIENVGSGPLGLAITPKGDEVYVVSVGDFNPVGDPSLTETEELVSVINTEENDVVAKVKIEYSPAVGGPRAAAITPDGAYAFVTNFGLDQVEVIKIGDIEEGEDNEVDSSIALDAGSGPNWVTISGHSRKRGRHYDYDDDDDDDDDD